MEGRKLQLTGGATFAVSLPKGWVVASGLKAGDTVFLDTEADGSVSVRSRPRDRPTPRRKVFEDKGDERRDHLLRRLIGAYIAGYTLLEVHFKPEAGPFVRQVAREFARMVIGPEVIEETRNVVVIQDLSDPRELRVEKCLRRMHLTVRAMVEDAVLALRDGDEEAAQDVAQRDEDVDRLDWVVAKQYHLAHTAPRGGVDEADAVGLHNYRLVAKQLERIGDHAERMARAVPALGGKGLDPRLANQVQVAGTSAIAILDKAFHALLTGDVDEANDAIDARSAHQKLVDGLSHHVATKRGEELLALAAIVDSLGRTAGYATDIAEIAINHAMVMSSES